MSPVLVNQAQPPPTPSPYASSLPDHILPQRLEKKISKLLKKSRLIYGSDASIKDNCGAFAWGILDWSNQSAPLVHFTAQLYGDEDQVHSTRGELFGILFYIRHISYLKSKYKIGIRNKIQVFIYTDSDSSIQITTSRFFLTSKTALDNDSDIKAEVRRIYKKYSKLIPLQFVRSQQDDDKPFKSLSLASILNVLMEWERNSSLSSGNFSINIELIHPFEIFSLTALDIQAFHHLNHH